MQTVDSSGVDLLVRLRVMAQLAVKESARFERHRVL